eukprot:TRINITY_DN11406_c0_g1_i1.p1 TRINITY_DN11406_c0_g1~~TRINITY_DN11406_c0_g1_i1.p1  ORF type:complete len:222 (+),score=11.80 TRINITY_DN11406_c0_g1_i1:78-743(+)
MILNHSYKAVPILSIKHHHKKLSRYSMLCQVSTLAAIMALSHLTIVFGQDQFNGSNICCYKFQYPQIPSFNLPLPQPNSPGDIQLNVGNPIILMNNASLNPGQGCNGDDTEYWNGTQWTRNYTDCNGDLRNYINIFYSTSQDHLNLRTIQLWQANLVDLLSNKTLRLWMTCNNGFYSCAEFTINGTSIAYADTYAHCPNEASLMSMQLALGTLLLMVVFLS